MTVEDQEIGFHRRQALSRFTQEEFLGPALYDHITRIEEVS